MLFDGQKPKKGIYTVNIPSIKTKLNSVGLTLESVEKQLHLLTDIRPEDWQKYRRYTLNEDEAALESVLIKRGYDIDDYEAYLPNTIRELEFLEDDGLDELASLYRMLLAIESENPPYMKLDITDFDIDFQKDNPFEHFKESFVNKLTTHGYLFTHTIDYKDSLHSVGATKLMNSVFQNLALQTMTESLLGRIIIAIVSFVILWAIVSIPVWISAKILTSGRASFGRAMLVTSAGPILYALVLIISTSLISFVIGNRSATITSLGLVIAFVAWIYVFRRGFETGWIKAVGIALFAIVVFVFMGIVIALVTHVLVPNVPPIITTQPLQSL
jgi:hypothetical protein